ncbi:Aminobenzoyl-glutamate utilization like protein [Tieghemostelium lacteum]|uniref:Aminobenzoyl-glutamate utilization like protein n=1 Tax=Tieghemostelium lacteum TaxID=361077 RepID=A0A151ZII5_TIELA|nr:Aminobenzoyl-glutamate utilization like protein [Tieghemostelium lacteum]|eukprot:KYQ93802.1 Aminobenzoyl-glutamate utilization like protein [Tieghemostelium lacteum]
MIDTLIKWRRQFHEFPELGWTEFVTTATLVKELRSMGLTVLCGPKVINKDFIRGRKIVEVRKSLERAKLKENIDHQILEEMEEITGCVAIYNSGIEGPTIAIRCDIDCVGVGESLQPEHYPHSMGFASKIPNQMHACGHDGHMTIGLGIAKWLTSSPKPGIKGKVKLLFQPAEEGVRGARPMAESGIVDDVDYYLSSHIGFIAGDREIVLNPFNFLCTTKYDFTFKGKPAHSGAEPHVGKNALLGACHATTQMMGIPRHGKGMSRVNVGVLRAGEGRNVIPSLAEMQIEVRGETQEINDFMCQEVERIAKGAAMSFDLELSIEIMGEAVDLVNDQYLVDLLSQCVTKHALKPIANKSFGGSEDSTILAKRVQNRGGKSIYFVCGSILDGGHHQSTFNFNEKDLETFVNLYIEFIQNIIEKH